MNEMGIHEKTVLNYPVLAMNLSILYRTSRKIRGDKI